MNSIRRISMLPFFALLFTLATVPAQCQGGSSTELHDVESKLATVTEQLNQTRTDLEDARAEIREMHKMLEELRNQVVTSQTAKASDLAAIATPAPTAGGASTEEKLQDVENKQDLAETQQALLNQTKVESSSKYHLRLSGMVLFNAFSNRGNSNDPDIPEWGVPLLAGKAPDNIGATMRQTLLGLEGTGPTLLGAHTSGEVHMDFFGGFPAADYGVTAGLVRLRTGDVRMDWERTSLIAGQEAPFISPLSPSSLAAVGDPALAYAGNLWTWLPQIWVEHRFHDSDQPGFAMQAGIMDPIPFGMPSNQSTPTPSAGEQSRQPAYASRISWENSSQSLPMQFGVGGYFSRLQYSDLANTVLNSWASTADWRLPITHRFEVTGEIYRGQSVASLGGGLLNNIVYNQATVAASTDIAGVNSVGGWTQLKWHTTSKLEWNIGAGQDNPFSANLQRYYMPSTYDYALAWNRASFANFLYRAKSNLLFSVEYRHTQTRVLAGPASSNDHVNLAAGYIF